MGDILSGCQEDGIDESVVVCARAEREGVESGNLEGAYDHHQEVVDPSQRTIRMTMKTTPTKSYFDSWTLGLDPTRSSRPATR